MRAHCWPPIGWGIGNESIDSPMRVLDRTEQPEASHGSPRDDGRGHEQRRGGVQGLGRAQEGQRGELCWVDCCPSCPVLDRSID